MGRRLRKEGWPWIPGVACSPLRSLDRRYVYDGWNLLLELNGLNNNAVLYKYTWGLDLAGQGGMAVSAMGGAGLGGAGVSPGGFDGAGGVGGLLAMYDTKGTTSSADDRQLVYFHDANGNVGQLIDSDPGSQYFGTTQARYEYYPFGGMLVSWGPYANLNPFKFSDKYRDDETSLYNFGLRDHMPRLGRFLERDPIGEQGGWNLYGFVGNSPVNEVDPLGLIVIGLWGYDAWGPDLAGKSVIEAMSKEIADAVGDKTHEAHAGTYWNKPNAERALKAWVKRLEADCESKEQFVLFGFSDGGTTLWRVIREPNAAGYKAAVSGSDGRMRTPAYFGVIDMVRRFYFPLPGVALIGEAPNTTLGKETNSSVNPAIASSATIVENYRGDGGGTIKPGCGIVWGWKGYKLKGVQRDYLLANTNHSTILDAARNSVVSSAIDAYRSVQP